MAKRTVEWYQLPPEAAIAELESQRRGLSEEQARARLMVHGPNALTERQRTSAWRVLMRQFTDVLVILLMAAAAVTFAIGEVVDAVVIAMIVLVNAVIGFFQEWRAGKALEALLEMTAPHAEVIRDGQERRVPARDVVPGDLVVLNPGERVPADLRLVETHELTVNESALTGEAQAVTKAVAPLEQADLVPGEQINMAFMGTVITSGSGLGVVVATGDETQFGAISTEVQETGELETPLKRRLGEFSRMIALVVLPISLALFALNFWRTRDWFEAFMTAVASAVGIIPEALPIVVTVALAVGVRRMARRKAILRRLPAVETLGSCTTICSDKTGTLTQNRMTVTRVWVAGQTLEVEAYGYAPIGQIEAPRDGVAFERLMRIALLSNDAELHFTEDTWRIDGDPTEGALVVLANKAGLARAREEAARPRLSTVPFTSQRQYMATLHQEGPGRVVYLKGAPERILPLCEQAPHEAREAAAALAAEGLRLLALAWKRTDARTIGDEDVEAGGFELAGLVGIIDPPRPEAARAVAAVKAQGVRVVMITGDHRDTAMAIGRQLGIIAPDEDVEVLTGSELGKLDDDALAAHAERTRIYARVQPSDKSRIVRALQANGEIVAMTGDGVNDAPALKAADIGVAMGLSGTDVAKEASDIVLADDNFATLEAAVEEGRVAFANIRKNVLFLLTTALGFTLILALPVIAGYAIALLPLQVLFVNLFANGLANMALAIDQPDAAEIGDRPRPPQEGVVNRLIFQRILLAGTLLGLAVIPLYLGTLAATDDLAIARSAALAAVIVYHQFFLFSCRSLVRPAHAVITRPNKWLWTAVAVNLAATLAVLYWPPLQGLFHTVAVPLWLWGPILALSLVGLVGVEIEKAVRRRLRPAAARRRA